MDRSLSYEKKYLTSVISKIDGMEKQFEETSADIKEQILGMRRRMWDDQMHGDVSPDRLFDLTQLTMTEQAEIHRLYDFEKRLKMLYKMRSSPYFARLDFIEEGEKNEESIYIGYISLLDGSDVLVCDWRADISSMYYDSPLGKTSYKTQYGDIAVDLTLRRQFKIRDSKLDFMFDSDIAIEDTVLQEELGKTADLKLKTIITTIQREQNAIIRDLSGDLLLVQGVAGSGKTSIALHRLAYLLYKYRNSLNSGNIVIFSPNGVFSSYIADVLPELGEEKVVQTDFYDFFDRLLNPEKAEEKPEKPKKKNDDEYPDSDDDGDDDDGGGTEKYRVSRIPTEDDNFYRGIAEQNEAVRDDPKRFSSVKLKGSDEFSAFLEKRLNENVGATAFRDVTFLGDTVLTADELRRAFTEDFINYTAETRKNKIIDRTLDHIENDGIKEKKLAEFVSKFKQQALLAAQQYTEDEINDEKLRFWATGTARLTAELTRLFSVEPVDVYMNALKAFSPEEYEKTAQNLAGGHLNFEDMLCVVYVSLLAGRIPQQFKINQIVVDEAQDYPPIIYKILGKLCHGAKFTILGDVNQALTPHLRSIAEVENYIPAKNPRVFNLIKSYRSTVEINNFINQFKAEPVEAEYLDRHGKEPEIIPTDDLKTSLIEKIKSVRAEGLMSNAIICRDEAHAKEIYAMLKGEDVAAKYIKYDSVITPGKTYVLPVYLTKGLEFDCVIIPDKNEFSDNANEKQLLYVACSRALHRLTLYEKK